MSRGSLRCPLGRQSEPITASRCRIPSWPSLRRGIDAGVAGASWYPLASGAAANTPRSARSSCRMCSRRSPASVGRTKFRDAESFRRIADYSSDFLGRPCAAADEMTASRLHRRAKYRAIRFNRCAVQGLAFSDKVSFQRGGLGLLRHQGRHLQSLTTRPCTKFS